MKTTKGKIVISAAMALIIVFFATQAVSAQEPYSLYGYVYNSTGATVPEGVTVYINDTSRQGGTGYVARIDTDHLGRYMVDLNKRGFIQNMQDKDVFICNATYLGEFGSCSFVLNRDLNAIQRCDIHLEAVIVPEEPSVTVRYPNGGESIVQGTSVQVSAHATDDVGVENVTFYYSANNGVDWNLIEVVTDPTTGDRTDGIWNATWDTTGLAPGSDYRINATATDSDGLTDTDTSDATFSIIAAAAVLNVTASQTTVYVNTPVDLVFNVTCNGAAVEGATVELSGTATGSGMTDANGLVTILVNATSAGTITVTASKAPEYTDGTTTITAETVPEEYRAVVLVYNEKNIGYNFFAWTGTTTNASSLATLINNSSGSEGCLPANHTVAYYNTTEGYFDGFLVDVNSIGSVYDFIIPQYGVVSVIVAKGGTFLMPVASIYP